MKLLSFQRLPGGLEIQTDDGSLFLLLYAENIIRLVYTKENEVCNSSLIVTAKESGCIEYSLQETNTSILLFTKQVGVEISRSSCACKWMDKNGTPLTEEYYRNGKQLDKREFAINTYAPDLSGKVGAMALKEIRYREAYQSRLTLQLSADEGIFGLGGHESGKMNRRDLVEYLYQLNFKAPIPFFTSTRGWGILSDNCSFGVYREAGDLLTLTCDCATQMDYYFINGGSIDGTIAGYRFLTGSAPMFPKWAFGYVQSKERYKTQTEVVDVVKEYRRRKIPLDLIVQDWRYWAEDVWSEKSFDPERFPDPAGMVRELHDLGAKVMISVWPRCSGNGPDHTELWKNDCLLGDGDIYNAFSFKARKTFWKQLNEGIFRHGFDAWWCDASEPYERPEQSIVVPYRKDPCAEAIDFKEEFCQYIDPEFINAYPLMHSTGVYEGQREACRDKRVVNLTRACYAGQQRNSVILWSGDISATWDTLKRQIAEGLNFCASGIPYWTLDIGGFFTANNDWLLGGNYGGDYDDGCNDMGYRELYLRWFQYAAFLPVFRSHGSQTPREVWNFGDKGDIIYDSLVSFIRLRYRLIPYIYSLAWQVTNASYTMLRALAFDFADDKNVYSIGDQFMFGSALMVCPVTTPMYWNVHSQPVGECERTRQVYLPGGIWYDFWTGQQQTGEQIVTAACPLETIPVYIKAGSIIPLSPVMQYTDEDKNTPIEIVIYPGADGNFTLYEDNDDGYEYENGAYATIAFTWDDANHTLHIGKRQGTYPGMQSAKELILVSGHTKPYEERFCQNGKKIVYNGDEMDIIL